MKKQSGHPLGKLEEQLGKCNYPERLRLLASQDDQLLWSLFRCGHREALVVLFRRHHRGIVVKVFQKRKTEAEVRLADVKDAFADFVEKIINGQFDEVELKKDFLAFAVHHICFLLKDRSKTQARRRALLEKQMDWMAKNDHALLRLENQLAIEKVINLIPKIGNRVYRMVLYLIIVKGYDSRDLTGVFGKSGLAYDKRSRAMKAFRTLLSKEGILEELK